MEDKPYDAVIIGAGIAGSAMAHALANIPRPAPWKIALVERSFEEPDRIVGEVFQPGGVEALAELGMEPAVEGYAVMLEGYNIINGTDSVSIPYAKGKQGRTFHHGKFVMGLRRVALRNRNVHPIEATATKLIECSLSGRVVGVTVTRQPVSTNSSNSPSEDGGKLDVFGDLVIVADGGFSKFRQVVLQEAFYKPEIYSYSVGGIMRDTLPPIPRHGTAILPEGLPPVFLIQLTETDTRIGVDIPMPIPKDLQGHLLDKVVPKLPESIREAAREVYEHRRYRMVPNFYLPSVQQATRLSKHGVFLLGDSWNTRHPITGAGMTVALQDVVYLRDAIEGSGLASLRDWDMLGGIIRQWHWGRKSHAATLNVLGSAMYTMMKRDGAYGSLQEGVARIRTPRRSVWHAKECVHEGPLRGAWKTTTRLRQPDFGDIALSYAPAEELCIHKYGLRTTAHNLNPTGTNQEVCA